ncbi:MAG TPA: peptidylprolyl isomerase [Candidatus Limnocylindrales bacterium]|nr:peptidylprolyl isomerase [Candidatus Limnocylindrales bacterium]
MAAAAVVGGITVIVAVVLLLGNSGAGPTGSGSPGDSGSPVAAGVTPPPGCPTSQPPALASDQTGTVTIQTKSGNIVISVDGSISPIAAGNFVALAQCGYYDGVTFHRLVPGFVIQGGDRQYGSLSNFDPSHVGQGGPGYTIQDEPVTAVYHRGTVAMARSQDPNSQGSQFFIVLDDSAAQQLVTANNYAIFGQVTSGMNVVDEIAALPNSGSPDNLATEPLAMDHLTVTNP